MILLCRRQFEKEMERHIEEHMSFPSIVMYVIFNEGENSVVCTFSWTWRCEETLRA